MPPARGRARARPAGRLLAGVGLLAGGAHRTAATMRMPVSACPSPAATDVGRAANPVRCSAAQRTSPDESPVNIRPVRLVPFAAGARPTSSTSASGSPNDGPGRPQYGCVGERRAPTGAGDVLAPPHESRTGPAHRDPRLEVGGCRRPRRPVDAPPPGSGHRGVGRRPGRPASRCREGRGCRSSSPVTGCGASRPWHSP